MALTAADVMVGVNGSVNFAPAATALPTDNTTALAVAFKDLGYLDESGVTQSIARSSSNIRAWQNGDIVRKVTTEHDVTYTFTPMETNAEVLRTYYNNFDAGTVEIKGGAGRRGVWVVEVKDGSKLVRIVIPDGEVVEQADVNFTNADAIKYPVTISAYPDASGVKAYLYTDAT